VTDPVPFGIDSVVDRSDEIRIVARGEVDIGTEAALSDAVSAVLGDSTGRPVVLDVRQVSFMDSSGLRAVLRSRDLVMSAGRKFRLAVSRGAVQKLFDAAGVSSWFEYE